VKLLLDTHIWVWSLGEPERLKPRVVQALQDPANELWLSPISVWEFLVLAQKKRVSVVGDPFQWVEHAFETLPVHEASLNREVAVRSRRLMLGHRDPADRFLAATALVYELRLVTGDERLLRAKALPLLSNR